MTRLPTPVDDVEYRVVSRALVTGSIVDLRLEPMHAPITTWRAGQYVLLGDVNYTVPVRSYSIANAASGDGSIRLLVTLVPGGGLSVWVHNVLQTGMSVLLSGPYGMFGARIAEGMDDPVLCLAGGSGIAPMIAFAESVVQRAVPSPFAVLFSARTAADIIDESRWRAWVRQYRHFRFDRTLTREAGEPLAGRIPGLLGSVYPDLSRHEVCVAGNPCFVRDCARAAREHGARAGHVNIEEFFAEPQPWSSIAATASTSTRIDDDNDLHQDG